VLPDCGVRCSRLEPYEAKVSRTVLRGQGWRKPPLLPDLQKRRCHSTLKKVAPYLAQE
jgi:hypothetical protein